MTSRISELGLFDSNCMLGRIIAPKPGFPLSVESLLEVMDDFEIAEALVYHSMSKEYHPAEGNEVLMDEIARIDRLHAMWVVMPSQTGEFPDEEQLVDRMLARNVKAARVFPHPDRHNFSLRHWVCEQLLRSLEGKRIPLVVDQEDLDWDTVYEVCHRYPMLPLVLTNVGYRVNRFLYPLLERFGNLHVELSNYCGHGGIEDLVKRFGAERFLFGTRLPYFTPGSAIAMLSYAGIGESERKLIAGDNLRNLLQLREEGRGKRGEGPGPANVLQKAESRKPKADDPAAAFRFPLSAFPSTHPSRLTPHPSPLLDRVKSALPMGDVPVIDCHGHLGSWQLVHMAKNSIEEMIETMDRLGIDMLCLSPFLGCFCDFRRGNDALRETISKYPDRLIGQITVNPNYPHEVLPELRRCESRYGVRMLKIHPFCHEYPVGGDGYRAFWEYADEKELVVLTHTWESDKNCGPQLFGKIAREHPKAKIILAHAGGTQEGCRQTIEVIKEHENLYLDTATSQLHVGMIERFVAEVGADRVLFGSDIPLLDPAAQLGRIAFAKIPEEDKQKILGLNIKRLLGE